MARYCKNSLRMRDGEFHHLWDDRTRWLWTNRMYGEYLEAGFLGLFLTSVRGQEDCIPPNSTSQVTKSPSRVCPVEYQASLRMVLSELIWYVLLDLQHLELQSLRSQQNAAEIWYVSIPCLIVCLIWKERLQADSSILTCVSSKNHVAFFQG